MEMKDLYHPISQNIWSGRIDGDEPSYLRWHQTVQSIDLNNTGNLNDSVVLLGFCCDEGVRRNQGRIGASEAPNQLRKILSNLPVHHASTLKVLDAGNVICGGQNLEAAQEELAHRVQQIRNLRGFPLVIGGGHEVTYGHFQGLKRDNPRKVGIINLDAHLDIRALVDGKGNSGTGFYQIERDLANLGEEFFYLAIGIQQISNTQALFDYAKQKRVKIIYADDVHVSNLNQITSQIEDFLAKIDEVYFTVDLDVFASAFAPGVSATAFRGLIPDYTFECVFKQIIHSPKLISMDIAELNPQYDIDNQTAKLAADLIFRFLQRF